MPRYSVLFFNPQGRPADRVQFEAASHEEARAIADRIDDPRAKELRFGSVPLLAWPAASERPAAADGAGRAGQSGPNAPGPTS